MVELTPSLIDAGGLLHDLLQDLLQDLLIQQAISTIYRCAV
jgi:hypothetical protein